MNAFYQETDMINQTKEFRYADLLKKIAYKDFFYRSFDIAFSIFAIIIFTPIMLVVALLIKVKSPDGSILFKQKRLGLRGEEFYVYKFRTMVPNAEEKLNEMLKDEKVKEEYFTFRKLKNDTRIIAVIGKFLRSSSLDELPQFFNVLLGHMSIVGPRPYIAAEFHGYKTKKEQSVVTSVKPGITGYWQVIPERHDTTFESRVETDMEYVEKKNFMLDLNIILKTVGVMSKRKGA
jgi:lipopolysaccharide/colanic/teichoic acid biosynthesis glycosyltransferase